MIRTANCLTGFYEMSIACKLVKKGWPILFHEKKFPVIDMRSLEGQYRHAKTLFVHNVS